MSWQRILEAARRHGMPVIATDIAGREPMVILPLEVFEDLSAAADFPMPVDLDEPMFEPTPEPMDVTIESGPSPEPKTTSIGQVPSVDSNPAIDIEDRFYLEPLDQDAK